MLSPRHPFSGRYRSAGLLSFVLGAVVSGQLTANEPWSVESFPHEEGFQMRISGMMERFAGMPIEDRTMARSVCPDTGEPVFTWAIEGEVIQSPYTGRRIVQGPTGYFGPKAKNQAGEITAFGGDPLKYGLPPATARFVLGQEDEKLKWYLGLAGSLRQHYHFAAVNWGRFWPMFHERMGVAWNEAFLGAVADYGENRRPSDGEREYVDIGDPENLVGRLKEHLGGGGTENHKTMWRSTALLYSEILPEGSLISGHSLAETRSMTREMLSRYTAGLYDLGSGEYTSSIYFPYSLRAFLNLYDYSPEPETRHMAKAALDYFLATYGLTVFNGLQSGAQRRGYPDSHGWNEMDRHVWAWEGAGTRPMPGAPLDTSIQQITSGYRPNDVISALIRKDVAMPFESWMNHPVYDMSAPDHHLEYFYCDEAFAMGSVQLPEINNSGQQTTWVLALRDEDGDTVTVTGGQPRWLQRGGHSPYDQYVQHRNVLLFMMDRTQPGPYGNLPDALEDRDQLLGHLTYDRYTGHAGELVPQEPPEGSDPEAWRAYLNSSFSFAGTWLWLPRKGVQIELVSPEMVVFRSGQSRVFLYPFGGDPILLNPETEGWVPNDEKDPLRRMISDRLLVLPGVPSGFALEVVPADRSDWSDADPGRLNLESLKRGEVSFALESGAELKLVYQGNRLRPNATLEGLNLIPDAWAGRGQIDSPYLKIRDGVMTVSDGVQGYRVEVSDPGNPVYQRLTGDSDR